MNPAIVDSTVDFGRRIVQMFWDPDPANDVVRDQPVWCLGSSYRLNSGSSTTPISSPPRTNEEARPTPQLAAQSRSQLPDTPPDSQTSSLEDSLAYDEVPRDGGWPPAFLDDFESRFWITYRSDFEPIARSSDPRALSSLSFTMRLKTQLSDQQGYSTDSGWGCMIRSGQMLLANAMAMHRLGRAWRRGFQDQAEKKLLSMFADDPKAPYSIHRFVMHGAETCSKYPGEWFGPSATARCIRDLTNATDPNLRIYSTGDGPDVYEDKFMKVAKPDGTTFHPTLILVGTRLGIDKITPVYWEALIASLQMPQSVGIAGGRPSSSHYFVGVQGLYFFYLDPHYTRPALPYHQQASEYSQEEVDTCHTRRLRRLHIREMDPSMLIGFLIRDEEDWKLWRRDVKHVQGKPIIHVSDHDPVDQMGEHGGSIDDVEALSDDDEIDVDTRQQEDPVE